MRKILLHIGFALVFSVSATFGRTVTGNNQFVSVSVSDSYSWQQICGLKSVVAVPSGEDIHVTTENLYETMYRATLTVEAQPGWRLIEPTGPVQVWPGRKINYRVKQTTGREVYKSGRIILFQVDVTLRNMGEQAEEFEGGLMTGFTPCIEHCALADYPMIPVSVSCTPSDEPGDIQLTASGGNLLVKNGNDYVPAANTYTASQLRFMQFWLYPNDASSDKGDHRVKVEHLVNHCLDTALFTTLNFDFTIQSDNVNSLSVWADGALADNHTATIHITPPEFINTTGLSYSFSAAPVENTDLIVNKCGTSITFTQTSNSLIFKTSKIYWYGIRPDWECYFIKHDYHFTLTVFGLGAPIYCNRHYSVRIPDEYADMKPFLIDPNTGIPARNPSSYSYVTAPVPTGDSNTPYRCEIVFEGFRKYYIVNVEATHQYADEVQAEECYHSKQWKGEVVTSNGGQTDCFTKQGLEYWMVNVGHFPINPCYIYGRTESSTYNYALDLLSYCEALELNTSWNIYLRDRGLIELKAKEYAGYNAAFRYHCTYQLEFGANPQDHVHPAFEGNNGGTP